MTVGPVPYASPGELTVLPQSMLLRTLPYRCKTVLQLQEYIDRNTGSGAAEARPLPPINDKVPKGPEVPEKEKAAAIFGR